MARWSKPGCTHAAICGLASYRDVTELLARARHGLGPMLSAFEVMWPDYWEAATVRVKGVRAPRRRAARLLRAGGDAGPRRGNRRGTHWIEVAFEDGVIEDAAIAQSTADIAAFWRTRDAAGEFGTFLGSHAAFDIGLPVPVMDEFAAACRQRLAEALPGVLLYYGHIADGNMHIVALVPGAATQPLKEIDALVYDAVRSFGGTISAGHGIGLKKRPYLGYTRSPEELALMARLKHALDPNDLLNPGMVLGPPTK